MAKRKYESLDPVKMYATLKRPFWKQLLENSMNKQDTNTLMKWRYGLQAGLADANANGRITTEKMDQWVIARIKDIENAVRYIVKERHPNPADYLNPDPAIAKKAVEAKRKRDREYQLFLMKSNF
jgi:hypothetical protein